MALKGLYSILLAEIGFLYGLSHRTLFSTVDQFGLRNKTCNGSKTAQRQDTERLMCNRPITMHAVNVFVTLTFL